MTRRDAHIIQRPPQLLIRQRDGLLSIAGEGFVGCTIGVMPGGEGPTGDRGIVRRNGFSFAGRIRDAMRIGMYASTALPHVGGAEMVVDRLARGWTSLGHQVTVLAVKQSLFERCDESAYPYEVVRHFPFFSRRYGVEQYGRFLRDLHARKQFDLIHCHDLYPQAYLAARLKQEVGVPVVFTSHGGDLSVDNRNLRKPGVAERLFWTMQRLDAMVAISRFTRDGFLRHCPAGVRVVDIPNGVDYAAYSATVARPAGLDPAIEPGRYLLFIGRLVGRKGVDVLLDALARIPDGGAVQLVLAGDGQEKSKLLAQCDRLHLRHRVRFVGMVGGAVKKYLLQNAVATVMPSRRWEGFPLVVLESYAAGTPVISSDVEGLGELIDASRAGMVFPSESSVELAALLRAAFDERSKMFFLGESARRFAEQYDWDRIVRRHLELFEALLGRERPLREAA